MAAPPVGVLCFPEAWYPPRSASRSQVDHGGASAEPAPPLETPPRSSLHSTSSLRHGRPAQRKLVSTAPEGHLSIRRCEAETEPFIISTPRSASAFKSIHTTCSAWPCHGAAFPRLKRAGNANVDAESGLTLSLSSTLAPRRTSRPATLVLLAEVAAINAVRPLCATKTNDILQDTQ